MIIEGMEGMEGIEGIVGVAGIASVAGIAGVAGIGGIGGIGAEAESEGDICGISRVRGGAVPSARLVWNPATEASTVSMVSTGRLGTRFIASNRHFRTERRQDRL
jgi:hypothetical protein